MKRNVLFVLCVVACLYSVASAATVAYWNFEQGTPDTPVPDQSQAPGAWATTILPATVIN